MNWIVEQDNGIFLPEINWHLDARKPVSNVFISHAHFDHFGNHPSILCSTGTSHLLKARLGGEREWEAHGFQEPFEIARGVRAELFPAGHIPGSSMILLEKEGSTLLYTGDFKLSSNSSAESCIVPKADTLIIETTYGIPKYTFPPVSEVIKDIIQFCKDTIEDGYTPILFGYSLGKAQEILKSLEGQSFRVLLHPQALKMTRACEEIGFTFPPYSEFNLEKVKGSVVISPPLSDKSSWLAKIPKRRTAMISGWALDSSTLYRSQSDRTFPLSDHADFIDLLEFVARVDPKRVFTTHGFAKEFAETLQDRGINAWELGARNQMGLGISIDSCSPARTTPMPATDTETESIPESIAPFAITRDSVEKANSERRKVEIVRNYFATLAATDVAMAALFLSGHTHPRASRRKLSVDAKTNRQAILFAAKATESDYNRVRQNFSDPQDALVSLLGDAKKKGQTLSDLRALFDNLEKAPNPVFQHSLLAEAYRLLSPFEAKSLINLVTGNLREAVGETIIEEALALRFDVPIDQVRRANLRCSDLERVSNAAIDRMLEYVPIQPFFPLKLEESAQGKMDFEFLSELAPPIWIEDLHDGLRCQIHKIEERVELFDENGTRITHKFPEIVESAALIPQDYIADGILVAWLKEHPLPFSELSKRINRPVEDLFIGEDIDTLLWLHDLLWFNGDSLLEHPLSFRKQELDTFSVNLKLRISPVYQIDSSEEIPSLLQNSQKRGNRGIIIKDATRSYNPLSPQAAWFTLK